MTVPAESCVWALNDLQNSMMLMPCWPSAGPTGGAGDACPPTACSLISVRTFLAISGSSGMSWRRGAAAGRGWQGRRPAGTPQASPGSRTQAAADRRLSQERQDVPEGSLDLLHLVEADLDRRLAAED